MAGFDTRDGETTESVILGETTGTSIRGSRRSNWREPTFCSPRMTKGLADNYVWQEDLAPSGACRLVVAITIQVHPSYPARPSPDLNKKVGLIQ